MTFALRSVFMLILLGTQTSINDAGSIYRPGFEASLEGLWVIDLRPAPDAPPYTQEFEVTNISGNSFEGTFYGSPLEEARINGNWDRLYFAFTTRDSSHGYYHSGYLEDGELYGVSYCPGREFVQPWTGVRK